MNYLKCVVMDLNDQNFSEEIKKATTPVLVDFYADWCGPCKQIAPVVEEIAGEFNGKLKVGKLNVDENQKSSAQYGVMSIPSLLIFNKGQVVSTLVGFRQKEAIVAEINKYV